MQPAQESGPHAIPERRGERKQGNFPQAPPVTACGTKKETTIPQNKLRGARMMRKLSIVLTAVALMAVMATAAFAQPNISGQVLVRTNVNFPESGDTTYTFLGRAQLNFSGSVSDQVS